MSLRWPIKVIVPPHLEVIAAVDAADLLDAQDSGPTTVLANQKSLTPSSTLLMRLVPQARGQTSGPPLNAKAMLANPRNRVQPTALAKQKLIAQFPVSAHLPLSRAARFPKELGT